MRELAAVAGFSKTQRGGGIGSAERASSM